MAFCTNQRRSTPDWFSFAGVIFEGGFFFLLIIRAHAVFKTALLPAGQDPVE